MIRYVKPTFSRLGLLFVLAGFTLASLSVFSLATFSGEKKPKPPEKKDPPKVPEKKVLPKDKTAPVLTLKGHTDWIYSVQFSPDGKSLITASRDKTVKVWDLSAKKESATLKDNPTNVKTAVFSPDGKWAVSTTGAWDKKEKKWEGEIRFWDVKAGKVARSIKGHTAVIEAIAFSADGSKLATAGEDETAIIWDVKAGKALQTLKGHKGKILAVTFNKDGSKLATAGADSEVKIWEVATGKELAALKGHKRDVTSVAFTKEGKIVTGSLDETVKLWDDKGKEEKSLEAPEGIWSVVISPDGKYVAASGWSDTLKVWSLPEGKELFYRNGHEGTVTHVIFSPDSQRIVSVGVDSMIRVWDMPK